MNDQFDQRGLVLLLAGLASVQWGWILHGGMRSGGLGLFSPVAMFALGMLGFYILPCVYWQIREWTYFYPGYFSGLPAVLGCVILFGLPFMLLPRRPPVVEDRSQARARFAVRGLGAGACLLMSGVSLAWKLFLITEGHQGVLDRDQALLLSSPLLTDLITNLSYISPLGYFLLVAHGSPAMTRLGKGLWIIDGLLTLFGLNRTFILFFVVQSAIQSRLLGWRLGLGRMAALGIGCLLLIGLLGRAKNVSVEVAREHGSQFLTPGLIAEVVFRTLTDIRTGQATAGSAASGSVVDDIANRLYEARSASAVIASVPDLIPYHQGSTFGHILYAFIPRAIWPEKPDLREIHRITTVAMPNDYGINPLGTLAEFYVNFGVIGVLMGGGICAVLILAYQRRQLGGGGAALAMLYCYPLLARWFLGVNFNFSQNVSELLRGFIVVAGVYALLRLSQRARQGTILTAVPGAKAADPVLPSPP